MSEGTAPASFSPCAHGKIHLIETSKYDTIEKYMRKYMFEALEEAKKAAAAGEIPVGAVIVHNGQIIGRGHNETETKKDPTAHAEILAIRQAARHLGGWRLPQCDMFVTVEPCSMCAGAIVQARIPEVMIGCMNPKAGCAGSIYNLLQEPAFNHQVSLFKGVLEEECSQMLKDFFRSLRTRLKT